MCQFFCCLILLAGSFVHAQSSLWKGSGGSIRFTSDAPLELIAAESDQLQGVIDPEKNTFAFALPTSSFQGFNSPLQQEHFHENYMESNKYPRASFAGSFIEDISNLKPGTHEVRAKGKLNIHGKTTERIIKCKLVIDEDGKVAITSDFSVPLADHQISIPRVVHQKIAEVILVNVEISLQPS